MITAIRRGGMPLPESLGSIFFGLAVAVEGGAAIAVGVAVEVAVEFTVEVIASIGPTIPTRPVFHGIGSTSGCPSSNGSGAGASVTDACGMGWCCVMGSNLPDSQILPVHRAEAPLLAHREVRQVLALLA